MYIQIRAAYCNDKKRRLCRGKGQRLKGQCFSGTKSKCATCAVVPSYLRENHELFFTCTVT